MTYQIHTICEKLSDKSEVFAVAVHDEEMPSGEWVRFEMISEKDAITFAEGLRDLINVHCVKGSELR